jgi:hypothetical protein
MAPSPTAVGSSAVCEATSAAEDRSAANRVPGVAVTKRVNRVEQKIVIAERQLGLPP